MQMKSLRWELKQKVDVVTTLEVDMIVLQEMLIENLQMEQKLELTKATPRGLQEELLHSEEWIAHVDEATWNCLGGCHWVGWGCS